MYNFKLNLKRNTFKQNYKQEKTSKIFKTKQTRIQERENESLKFLNFIRDFSNNIKQQKRDFCPFLKSNWKNFSKKYTTIFFVYPPPKKKKKKKKKKDKKMNNRKLLKI